MEEGRKSYADMDRGGKREVRTGSGAEADLGRWVAERRRRTNAFDSAWRTWEKIFFQAPHSWRLVIQDKS
jgi:hypothetical protein